MKQPERKNGGKGHIFPPPAKPPVFGKGFSRAGVIGLHPLAGMLAGGGIGYYLWQKFATQWCFWLLLLAGFIAGCLNAYRDARAMLREEETGTASHVAKNPPQS